MSDQFGMDPVAFENKEAIWFEVSSRVDRSTFQFIHKYGFENLAQALREDRLPLRRDITVFIQNVHRMTQATERGECRARVGAEPRLTNAQNSILSRLREGSRGYQ